MIKYVVENIRGRIYETYSKEALLDFMDEARSMGVKDLTVFHELAVKENNILEKIKMSNGQLWRAARQAYGNESVVMIDGELFFIRKSNSIYTIVSRILSDLTLSADEIKIMF